MTRKLITLSLAALLGGGGANAQYREGLPAVATPPPRAPASDPSGSLAGFASAYQRHKSPRMVVFWNRSLTDSTTSSYELRSDSQSDMHEAEDLTLYPDGRTITRDRSTDSSTRLGLHRSDEGKREGLSERADWDAEEGFNRAMLANGVRLVDRTMAIRATAAGMAGGGDAVAAESAALTGKADLLVEILQTPDASAPSGYAFRVDVKDVRSGALLANFVTGGNPPRGGPGRFIAGSNGYERERPRAPGIGAVGAQVGRELLLALMTRW